jgi:hypothetical protein
MEPNKLENQFKEKLNLREIKPTKMAWDRLDAMLTITEEKKPKRNYDWMYVAASIIGFVFIGILFFSQTEELVDVKRNEVVLDNKEITKPSENTIQKQTETNLSPSISSSSIVEVSELKKVKNNSKETKIINSKQNQVAQNRIPKSQNPTLITHNQKSEQLKSLNQNTVNVDERITAVENPSKNEIQKSSVKVDANNLLSQVDGELELSFREKVINTIGKNYKTVKVALANRNQE